MVTFDSFLNWVIPPAIFIFFMFVLYNALKEPIDKGVGAIKSLIGYFKKSPDADLIVPNQLVWDG